jgi:hypothetical protein
MEAQYPVILSVSSVVIVVTGVIIWLISGSWAALIVVVVIAGVVFYFLTQFGKLSVQPTKSGINVDVDQLPNADTKTDYGSNIKEVFHISDNMYTFDEAPAVCAAYGAELATYDQLLEAQIQGAEWCGYGWSATGMGLYPTSQATWEALQRDPKETRRVACGHPGVNGGYFDPRMKFGVNCYGRKPPNTGTRLPIPLPGTDDSEFQVSVNKFKSMLTSMKLSPFNRDIWSKMPSFMQPGPAVKQPIPTQDTRSVPMQPTPAAKTKQPTQSVPEPTESKSPKTFQELSDSVCKDYGIGCPVPE